MAINVQTFKTRALTALIFVLVMLAGLFWNSWSFFILFSIIHFGCWIEYQKLVALIDKGYAEHYPLHKYGVMIAGWCIMLYFTKNMMPAHTLSLHAIGWWMGLIFVFLLPIIEILFARQHNLKNVAHSFFGLLYISLSWGLMMDLYNYTLRSEPGTIVNLNLVFPLVIIVAMWINDTMAYLTGSFIGKTPFSSISPKKTWEGTIGGVIFCVITIALLSRVIVQLKSVPVIHWIMIALICAVIGNCGDLLESKLKRLANVKDSGSIMPGHGGFLDRFDSLLLTTPFVWAYVMLFM
jgi:phosphatidate cytidylyltransferase